MNGWSRALQHLCYLLFDPVSFFQYNLFDQSSRCLERGSYDQVPIRCDDKGNTPATGADYFFNWDLVHDNSDMKSTVEPGTKKRA
jgi:hypothetical protein